MDRFREGAELIPISVLRVALEMVRAESGSPPKKTTRSALV